MSEQPEFLEKLPSPRYLRIFEAVARLESLTKAAEEVRLSQPALTQTIAKLEAEVGKQLLERKATGTYVTTFGQKYLIRTRRFFQHIEHALAEIMPEDKAGILRKAFRITRSQMRCHVMISRSRSFAQAAAEAGVSEASLHKAARELELNLGISLYRKSLSGMITTEAGNVLARAMLLGINEMQSAAEELSAGSISPTTINVGVPILDPAPFLAVVLNRFSQAHPEFTIRVVNSTFDDIRQRIRLGLLDFAVGVLKEEPQDLRNEALFEDPYFVAARKGHPLAGHAKVTAEQLLAYDWIVPNPGAPRRQAFDHLFRDAGRKPHPSIESHSFATIRATLFESDRLTILTRSEVEADERIGVLVRLNTEGLEPIPVIGMTTRADWLPTPGQADFVELLRQHGAES